MALGTYQATIGGTVTTLIGAKDGSNNLAAAHVNITAAGVEIGTVGNPWSMSLATSIPAGAATIGAVTQASGPWSVSWSGQTVAATQSGTWTFQEQQLRGVHDDGTNEGIVRAKIVQGDLVKVGADAIQCSSVALGTSTITFQIQSNQYNSDGSNQAVVMVCASGSNNGVFFSRKIYGKVVGVRYLRTSVTPNFDVVIDGTAYPVTAPLLQYDGAIPSVTPQDGEAYIIVADDLPDGEHTVAIVLTPDAAIGGIQTLNVFGFLAERRAGYVDRTRVNDVVSNGTLTTTATTIARTTLKNIRKIDYTNTSASTATVTVTYSAAVIWQKAIAAGDTQSCDFGDLITFSGQHLASAASSINYIIYGRN